MAYSALSPGSRNDSRRLPKLAPGRFRRAAYLRLWRILSVPKLYRFNRCPPEAESLTVPRRGRKRCGTTGRSWGTNASMNSSHPIRPVDDSELAAFGKVTEQAFNSPWPPEEMLRFDRMVVEPERTLVAFDGSQMIGTTLAFSFGLTAPGGCVVGAAGISGVGVLPTHRRRRVLSSLMRRQLPAIAARGQPVAMLFASESVIYGRYGYGSAAEEDRFN